MEASDNLGQFEQLVLAAVFILGRTYAAPIRAKMEELAARRIELGPVHVTLDRLQRKGYVSSWMSDGSSRRLRRYYHIEDEGDEVLGQALRIARRMLEAVELKRRVG